MSEEMFDYMAGAEPIQHHDAALSTPGPLFPDFNPNSEMTQKMVRAKRINDGNFWTEMRPVFDHDFKTLPLDRYKVWASTLNVPIMSRFRSSEYMKVSLLGAQMDPRVEAAITEPMVGCTPIDFQTFFQVLDDKAYSVNRMQHYGHLAMNGMSDPAYLSGLKRIVEIGAGAGEMADVVRKLGFEGEYVTYDFPELLQIQKWFHDKLGHTNNTYVSDVNELQPADLVIATWSLTEMPLELREQVVKQLGDSRDWLIAYSNQIFGFDNDAYMLAFAAAQSGDKKVVVQDIPWMPWDGGTKYMSVKAS